MIRQINKNSDILSKKSVDATKDDAAVIQDLYDTLSFNKATCVGMAANMIGVSKNIIAFIDNNVIQIMINPYIMNYSGTPYIASEGCLSLKGTRQTKRYPAIKVEYLDKDFKKRIKTFSSFTAEIIQHEFDHLQGVLI